MKTAVKDQVMFGSTIALEESDVRARAMLEADLQRLACALSQLSQADRDLIGLTLIHGLSIPEIALARREPPSTTATQLRAAERRLIDSLMQDDLPPCATQFATWPNSDTQSIFDPELPSLHANVKRTRNNALQSRTPTKVLRARRRSRLL